MGSSPQQHRVVTGLFYGRMCSSSWTASTGAYKLKSRDRSPDPDLNYSWAGTWLTSLVVTALALGALEIATASCEGHSETMPIMVKATSTTLSTVNSPVMERTSAQIRSLLIMAGDVETNPGPAHQSSDDNLIAGLADLVGQAPASMRDVLCVWSPQKPCNVIAAELGNRKYTVAVLQPVLAWLLNKDVNDPVVKSLKKAELAQEIIYAIERLLPDTCGECKHEYAVSRLDNPGLKCKGCGQGFHQPCLERLLDGKSALPSLPGSLYWLCGSCTPCYELVTTLGHGGRSKPTRGRLAPNSVEKNREPGHSVHVGVQTAEQGVQAAQIPRSPTFPPATVRSGLPFLWAGVTDTSLPVTVNSPPIPPPLPAATVRSGLPYLWAGQALKAPVECQQYLNGDCPHGISGKVNGVCSGAHKKRCIKYMKWGNSDEKGCSGNNCDKAHPVLCPRSLQLKCLTKDCPYKYHTSKCVRQEPASLDGGPHVRHVGATLNRGVSHIIHPCNYPQQHTLPAGKGDSVGGVDQQVPAPSQAPNSGLPSLTQPIWGGQGVSSVQLGHLSHPPPGYTRSGRRVSPYNSEGLSAQQSFQEMTVQHMLEAYIRNIQQELASQREIVRLVQQQLNQQLPPHPVRGALAQGARVSF